VPPLGKNEKTLKVLQVHIPQLVVLLTPIIKSIQRKIKNGIKKIF
jgi:hypothetical protein